MCEGEIVTLLLFYFFNKESSSPLFVSYLEIPFLSAPQQKRWPTPRNNLMALVRQGKPHRPNYFFQISCILCWLYNVAAFLISNFFAVVQVHFLFLLKHPQSEWFLEPTIVSGGTTSLGHRTSEGMTSTPSQATVLAGRDNRITGELQTRGVLCLSTDNHALTIAISQDRLSWLSSEDFLVQSHLDFFLQTL